MIRPVIPLCLCVVAANLLALSPAAANKAAAEDWPVYQHDNRRSCATPEKIDAAALGQDWAFRCPQFPQTAWHGPSRYDHYHRTGPFVDMREYDPVYYPVIVGGSVFFATSGDDSVYCLDAAAGKVRWTFTAGMLPWRESYLCAVDAATGKATGKGRFVIAIGNRTPEGAMAAFKGRLLQPNGEYDVTVAVSGKVSSLKVEDVVFCNAHRSKAGVETITKRVRVADHKLTLGTDTSGNQNVVGPVHYLTFRKR